MKSSCFNAMNRMTTDLSRGRARFAVGFHNLKKLCCDHRNSALRGSSRWVMRHA